MKSMNHIMPAMDLRMVFQAEYVICDVCLLQMENKRRTARTRTSIELTHDILRFKAQII